MTKKFGGGSVSSLCDFYDNQTVDTAELRANLAESVDCGPLPVNSKLKCNDPNKDKKLLHFGVKTKIGALPVESAVNQLKMIAEYLPNLPDAKTKRFMFSIEVWEDNREGKTYGNILL